MQYISDRIKWNPSSLMYPIWAIYDYFSKLAHPIWITHFSRMAQNVRFNKCLCVASATEISRFIVSVPCEICCSQRLSSAVAASETQLVSFFSFHLVSKYSVCAQPCILIDTFKWANSGVFAVREDQFLLMLMPMLIPCCCIGVLKNFLPSLRFVLPH